MKITRLSVVALLALLSACGGGGNSGAASSGTSTAGTLDTSFNSVGSVTQSPFNGYGVAVDSKGRIVIAGSSASQMAIARYNADGTLDKTFNASAIVPGTMTAPLLSSSLGDLGRGVAVDSNDRIVVVGQSTTASATNLVIWRYNSDGSVDSSFNAGAPVLVPGCKGMAVAISSSGKLLVAGQQTSIAQVWRYNDNGTQDLGFGSSGVYMGPFGDARGIRFDQSGRILVTGSDSILKEMFVVRLTGNGVLDTTFNTSGMVRPAVLDNNFPTEYGQAVTTDSKGNVLVTGFSADNGIDVNMTLRRWTDAGATDTTFNNKGTVPGAVSSPTGVGYAVAVDGNSKIVVVGRAGSATGGTLGLWRYNSDGTLDTNFNVNGTTPGTVVGFTTLTGYTFETGYGMFFDSNGRIVIGGNTQAATAVDNLVVWRYRNN